MGLMANTLLSPLTETTLAGNDASQNVVVPAKANAFSVHAEAGPAYISLIPGATASTSSGIYVAQDEPELLGPFNAFELNIFAATGTSVHITFFAIRH